MLAYCLSIKRGIAVRLRKTVFVKRLLVIDLRPV